MTEFKPTVFELYSVAKNYIASDLIDLINFSNCINRISNDKESKEEFHRLILKDIENGFLRWIDYYYYLRYADRLFTLCN